MESPVEKMMREVPMKEVHWDHEPTQGLPFVTHEGVLDIGGIGIEVVQLNTGVRLITTEGIHKFFEAFSPSALAATGSQLSGANKTS